MTLATAQFEFLRTLVAEQSGNQLAPRQACLIEQRLAPIAESIGVNSLDQLVDRLRTDRRSALSKKVAEAVTVNETSFFRDMHVYESLKTTIIPTLVERNGHAKRIRIWCAACSSGQEPYSIAMIFREHFPQLTDWKVEITATDLCEDMVGRVRDGSYSQLEVNRGLPARNLVRFFDRDGTRWRAKQELRGMIDGRQLNLTQRWPLAGQFDLVLLRNVLIYFDREVKSDILLRVRRLLSSDGYMFIGAAETIIGLNAPYTRQEINGTVCYRPTSA